MQEAVDVMTGEKAPSPPRPMTREPWEAFAKNFAAATGAKVVHRKKEPSDG